MKNKNVIVLFLFLISFYLIVSPSSSFPSSFSLPPVLPGETQQINILGNIVKIKGLTDQANTLTINGKIVPIQMDGSFQEDIIIPLGETEILVTVEDTQGNTKVYKKTVKAKKDHFFLVGIADGTFNFSKSSKGFEWERDSKHFKEGFRVDGKLSYYLVGRIMGKFLIKSGLDTDKSTQEKLFTNIDPDKYYPIYGDSSTVVYDVNSQGKFYALVEWDKSGLTFGNYQTMIEDEDMKLATYSRTLYGGKLHIETNKHTIYGEPITKLTGFIAEANQHAGHSEFLATGGSLYYLRHRNIVEGSENIRIEVRDKNSGMVLCTAPQQENIDYEIKYDEGRILFKRPVLTVSSSNTIISQSILEGNLVYVAMNYEYKNQEAFPILEEDLDNKTGGLRISQAINDNIRIGGTYVQETKDNNKNYKLYGADTVFKIGNFTKITAEIAESVEKTVPLYVSYNGGYDFTEIEAGDGVSDKAIRIGFNSNIGEFFKPSSKFLDVAGYYQYIGDDFISNDALFESGTKKYGMELTHKLTENDKIRLLYEKKELDENSTNRASKNELAAKEQQIVSGQWSHTWNKLTFTTEYMFKDRSTPYNYQDLGQEKVKEHFVGERIQYDVSKDTSLSLGGQIEVLDAPGDYQTLAEFASKISDDKTLTVQARAGKEDNSILFSLQKEINEDLSSYITQNFSKSSTDGRTSITSFGTNTKINKKAKMRTERQFITSDQRGTFATNLMAFDYQPTDELGFDISYQRRSEDLDPNLIGSTPEDTFSGSVSYADPDSLKCYSKSEYRKDLDGTWQVLTDNQAELKLSQDLFLFGEYEHSVADRDEQNSYSRIDKKEIGVAYRPIKFDWFNLLFKYIRFTDKRPEDVLNPDGGFFLIKSTSDVFAGECALDLPFNFQLVEKVSYKNEDTLSYEINGIMKTPENLKAYLTVHRLNYHLTNRIDLATEYRRLDQKGSDKNTEESGFLSEITYQLIKNISIGAGMNFTSFTDDFTDKDYKSARGFFCRLQGKH